MNPHPVWTFSACLALSACSFLSQAIAGELPSTRGDDGGPIRSSADPIESPADPIQSAEDPIKSDSNPVVGEGTQDARSLGITNRHQDHERSVVLGPDFEVEINGTRVQIQGEDPCSVQPGLDGRNSENDRCLKLPINGPAKSVELITVNASRSTELRAKCASDEVTTPFHCRVVRVYIPGSDSDPGFYVSAESGEVLTRREALRANALDD